MYLVRLPTLILWSELNTISPTLITSTAPDLSQLTCNTVQSDMVWLSANTTRWHLSMELLSIDSPTVMVQHSSFLINPPPWETRAREYQSKTSLLLLPL